MKFPIYGEIKNVPNHQPDMNEWEKIAKKTSAKVDIELRPLRVANGCCRYYLVRSMLQQRYQAAKKERHAQNEQNIGEHRACPSNQWDTLGLSQCWTPNPLFYRHVVNIAILDHSWAIRFLRFRLKKTIGSLWIMIKLIAPHRKTNHRYKPKWSINRSSNWFFNNP